MFTTVLHGALQVTTINKTPNKINIKTQDMNLKWLQKTGKHNKKLRYINNNALTTERFRE